MPSVEQLQRLLELNTAELNATYEEIQKAGKELWNRAQITKGVLDGLSAGDTITQEQLDLMRNSTNDVLMSAMRIVGSYRVKNTEFAASNAMRGPVSMNANSGPPETLESKVRTMHKMLLEE